MFISNSGICKSKLRRSDRIAAMCIENMFFKNDLRGKPKNRKTNIVDVDNLPLERGDNDDDEETENNLTEKNGKKRTNAEIIRSLML